MKSCIKSVSRRAIAGSIFALGILLLATARVAAQNQPVKFEHITPEHGLSNSQILCILQDRQGFMWFGTLDGLNKYDGYSFTVYKHDPANPKSLSDNSISSLCEDRSGVLWIGTTGGGLNKFDRETNTFTSYQHDSENPNSLSVNDVRAVHEDSSGVLWIGTWGGGLNKLVLSSSASKSEPELKDDETNQAAFTHFVHDANDPNSLSNNIVYTICEDRSGVLWIGTIGGGLNKFDQEQQIFTSYNEEHDDVDNNILFKVFEDHDGMLWIGSAAGGLNRFNRETGKFTSYLHDPNDPKSLSHNRVISIAEDHLGALWVATLYGGLNRFDKENEEFLHFQHNSELPHSLNSEFIISLFADRSGALWIGTQGGGVNKLDREKQKFQHYAYNRFDSTGLSSRVVTSLYEGGSGTLWLGTLGGGPNRFDGKTGTFTHFAHILGQIPSQLGNIFSIHEDRLGVLWIATWSGLFRIDPKDHNTKNFKRYESEINNPNSLSGSHVLTIHEDSSGVLWFGTAYGLNRFERKSDSFKRFLPDPKGKVSWLENAVWKICEDRFKNLWLFPQLEMGGINRFDRATETFTHYRHDANQPSSLSDNQVYSILEDRFGTLWVGTRNGLNQYDRSIDGFIHYQYDPQNQFSLSNNSIRAIYEDSAGTLWIGTNAGLNRLERLNETFVRFGKKEGLATNEVRDILEDGKKNLWLITDKGLSRFNPQIKFFKNYDQSDGLQGRELDKFHKGAISGVMYIGGFNGLNVFHPDSIRENPYIPPMALTRSTRFNADDAQGSAIMDESISSKKQVELSYKDNILTFEFAALSYLNNAKNQYAYKLEGFNDNWIHLGTKREVTFTNLDPGDYTLRVKGSNNDGIWNEEGASLKITITPPWWKTTWAYALYVLCAASLLYGLRRYEMNRLRLKSQLELEHVEAEKMKELDHLKSRFFANISHEFRTPLTLILGPVEQMRSNDFKGNVHEAYDMILRNGRRLLRLINQLLDLARLEAGSMSLQTRAENIVSFIKGLVLSFASAAERKRIDLSVSCEEESIIVYFDRDKLEKIVSNLVSNALKFTPEGGKINVIICLGGKIDDGELRMENRGGKTSKLDAREVVELCVKDSGPGIPGELREKIFDRFYQVDASHTREHEGTGIGLALTKELVELHRGDIAVESEVGRGARFIVRLPLGKAHLREEEVIGEQSVRVEDRESRMDDRVSSIEDQATSFQDRASNDQQPETSNQILLIEDNRDVRAYIRQYLEPEFRVIEAADGVEGVTLALETIPDLVICDVMMPKRDGYEVCRVLKTEEKTSHVPIIMLTAKADRESKVHGLETGADDYVIKPFDAAELLARVFNLIKLRQQLRARFGREITLQPKDLALTSMDEQFLTRAMQIVEEHMSESELGVEFLAHKIGMSRVHLNRKLRALTDQTANEFIRTLRLKRAAQLLAKKSATVLEIAYEVGFNNPSYFAECFEKQFGVLPSKFAERDKS